MKLGKKWLIPITVVCLLLATLVGGSYAPQPLGEVFDPSGNPFAHRFSDVLPYGVQGDVLYHDGTQWTRLVAGTSGDFLKTLGSGNNPTWDTAAAGGDALITVAANNTPAAQKARADFVCGGANDDVTIEALVAAGVTVKLMVGDYIFGSTLDIVVSNFRLEGSGPGTVISGAIAVSYIKIGDDATYVEAVTICDLSIDGTSQTNNYGIHLDGGSAANRCENISILHCFIHDTYTGAILAEYTHNSLFEGNYIEDATFRGFDICSDSVYNRICDNYFHSPASGNEGVRIDSSDYNVITGNIFNDYGARGVDLNAGSYYNTVTGNLFLDNVNGVRINAASDHNTVSDNVMFGGTYGIYISASDYNTVSGNNCFENSISISLSDALHNTITGNMGEGGTSGDETIQLMAASCHNTITGNTCQNNLKYGIYLVGASNNNTISGNTCQGNDRNGIFISASHSNNITGNTCVENSQAADNTWANIMLTGADYNLLEANLCRMGALANQPDYGIELDDSDWNIVRDNDLYDSGLTGPILDNGVDNKFNNITFQFIQGSVFIDADGSAKGWEVDLADEYAIALGQLPLELTQVVRIKIWGVALALTGAGIGMLLEINMNAGQDDEIYTAEAIAIANKVSATLNFAADDVIHWVLTSADDANIGTLAGGDSLEVKVKFEALANGDIDTDAVFRTVEIEYVP